MQDHRTVASTIDGVARRHARKEALVWNDQHITYAGLQRQVDAVARGCLELGLRKGDKVALLIPNRPEYVYAFLGVTKVGCIVVPINPTYRRRELEHILKDSEAVLVIAVPQVRGYALLPVLDELRPALPRIHHYVLLAGDVPPWAMRYEDFVRPDDAPLVVGDVPGPDDIFGLIYTSGTTGVPKGTIHTHASMMAPTIAGEKMRRDLFHFSWGFVRRMARTLKLYGWRYIRWGSRQQTFCGPAPFHAMAGYGFMLHALTYGYRFVILDHFEPRHLMETIQREHVNVFTATPTVYHMLLGLPDLDKYDTSSVILMSMGAAPCPPALAREVRARFGCAVTISFGATETSGVGTLTDITDADRNQAETVGRSYPTNEVKIVDEQRREVARGVVGEVAMRSPAIMKGYYKAPEATAQVLDAEGWYYTGDLGTMDEHGYVRIVGRKRDLIIRGGQNIFPVEIENVLVSYPGVGEAAVFGVPGGVGGETVWAFVVARDGKALSETELLNFVRREIAAYKVPDHVRLVPELPHTATGKVPKYQLTQQVQAEIKGATAAAP